MNEPGARSPGGDPRSSSTKSPTSTGPNAIRLARRDCHTPSGRPTIPGNLLLGRHRVPATDQPLHLADHDPVRLRPPRPAGRLLLCDTDIVTAVLQRPKAEIAPCDRRTTINAQLKDREVDDATRPHPVTPASRDRGSMALLGRGPGARVVAECQDLEWCSTDDREPVRLRPARPADSLLLADTDRVRR